MRNFWQKLSTPLKVFTLLWLLILVWGLFLLAPVLTGSFAEKREVGLRSSLSNNPQILQQMQQMLRRGISQKQLEAQLGQMVRPVAEAQSAQRARSLEYGIVAFLIAGALILWLKSGNISPQNRQVALGALLFLLVLQGFYMATRYIIPDPKDYKNLPEGIKKLQKLDPLYRVHAPNKPLYNAWITEYFPLCNIPCIDVPADSRPSVWRRLFFYTPERFSLPRRVLYSNVGYLLCSAQEAEYLKKLGLKLKSVGSFSLSGSRQEIMEVENPLPRFFAPKETKLETEAEKALAFMNGNTSPLEVTLIHEGLETSATETGENKITLKNYTPEKVDLQADFAADGYAVLACEPLPGWFALIDGKKAPVIRCNLMHQAVFVPKGTHEISFVYERKEFASLLCDWAHLIILPLLFLLTLFFLGKNAWAARKS